MKKLAWITLLPLTLQCYEIRPWLGKDFVLDLSNDSCIEHFSVYDSDLVDEKSYNTVFANQTNLSVSYGPYEGELEICFARTSDLSLSLEHFAETFRYQFWSDIVGDPVSFVSGVTVRHNSQQHVLDPARIQHGRLELDLHSSVGKEYAPCAEWSARFWGATALTLADHGSPMSRYSLGFDVRLGVFHLLEVDLSYLHGWGGESFQKATFNGYGGVDHRTFDFKTQYTILFPCYNVSLYYRGRLDAKNAPENLNSIGIVFEYPLTF